MKGNVEPRDRRISKSISSSPLPLPSPILSSFRSLSTRFLIVDRRWDYDEDREEIRDTR